MRAEDLALALRPRTHLEAADLGVRLCQHAARDVFPCHLTVLLPLTALSLATSPLAPWAPALVLWWLKPWLDRTALFVLSRAAFGERARPADLWRHQRQVLWSQPLLTLTARRLSPWRAFTQPVYQLEGQKGRERLARVRTIRGPHTAVAGMITALFSLTELILLLALLSLAFWLAPRGYAPSLSEIFAPQAAPWTGPVLAFLYAAVVALLEPFHVAAGFGMYLNRRVELEAWDLEQELRRAFA